MAQFIYQLTEWPNFTWQSENILFPLGKARNLQGKLMSKMEALGFVLRGEAMLETLTVDAVKSAEIEGEILPVDEVRSSIARRLGIDISRLLPSDLHVDGMVEMLLDATQQFNKALTTERLFNWQAALFPTGRSGLYKIEVGKWRTDKTGPMQVISGPMAKEKIHFQAPDASTVRKEMSVFMKWFNKEDTLDPVLKAAIAHFWFVTIHPFDDGNGRIARAITDMQLAKADGSAQRFYSMSAQIRKERKMYYKILEKIQSGNLDISEWILWFIE
ncbi:MAG: Fic family protein, partial [Chitinophagales bacterium]